MDIVKYIGFGIFMVICVAIIIITTIQKQDSRGASGTITGSSTNNFYEKNKGRTGQGKLKRDTIGLSIAFAVVAIVLGILMVM